MLILLYWQLPKPNQAGKETFNTKSTKSKPNFSPNDISWPKLGLDLGIIRLNCIPGGASCGVARRPLRCSPCWLRRQRRTLPRLRWWRARGTCAAGTSSGPGSRNKGTQREFKIRELSIPYLLHARLGRQRGVLHLLLLLEVGLQLLRVLVLVLLLVEGLRGYSEV